MGESAATSNALPKDQVLRQECWDKALLTLGTSYVFSQRAITFNRRIRVITILGLIVPVLVGAIAATYGTQSSGLFWALVITGPVGIAQLVLSCISLVYKWEDQLAYSLESQTENRALSDEFKKLAKLAPDSVDAFEHQFDLLSAKEKARTAQDEKLAFSANENRKGMRYGLMIFGRACVGCKLVPISMDKSTCPVCGIT